MAANLRLTTAGRDAIIDPANVGTQAIQIRKLALGDGQGPGGARDDGRTTLRSQRDIEGIEGSAAVNGRFAVRATINSATAYAATEMGLFARVGDGGVEFLFAYWTDDGTVFVNKPASIDLIVVASVGIIRSAADVMVTVSPNLTIGAVGTLLDLSDGPGTYVNAARRKVAINAAGNGFEFVAGLLPSETAAVAAAIAAAVADLGGVTGAANAKSANYAVLAADNGNTIAVDAAGGARTVTLPDLAAADDGFTVTVMKTDASTNAVTVDGNGADTINGAATYALESRYEGVTLKWTGAEWLAIGGASTSWLRDFFGAASSVEIAAGGTHSWAYDATKCLAVIDGGGGGGGGGTTDANATSSFGGDGGDRPGGPGAAANNPSAGGGGTAGGDTTVTVDGNAEIARGGGGGGGGSHNSTPQARGHGGDGPHPGYPSRFQLTTDPANGRGGGGSAGNGGDGGAKAPGGALPDRLFSGADGGAGERKVVLITGLQRGTQIAISIGAGGAGGVAGLDPYDGTYNNNDGSPGVAGGPGKVTLYPVY